eukprot:scaffold3167_cov105-Isochrysis_galbana.AAC.2
MTQPTTLTAATRSPRQVVTCRGTCSQRPMLPPFLPVPACYSHAKEPVHTLVTATASSTWLRARLTPPLPVHTRIIHTRRNSFTTAGSQRPFARPIEAMGRVVQG